MATDQLLRGRQPETRAPRIARHERVKDRFLQVRRDAGAVILDLDARDDAVANIADREVRHRTASQA